MNSEYQKKASQALRKGLLDYDTRHGFKGPIAKIDPKTLSNEDWQEIASILAKFQPSGTIIPVIVKQVEDKSFQAWDRNGETLEVQWENMVWAKKYIDPNNLGPEPNSAGEIASPGDILYVEQIINKNEQTTWKLSQIPEVSGALVSLDPNTGAIFALTGGFDYFLSKFNRATQAQRQPGSNIKPFIYSAALENGFTPASLVSAAPIIVEDDLEGIWKPQNYSKKFFGPTRLRKALSLSLNLVSVRLLRAMGIDRTINHLAKFGFKPDELPHNLSLALGSTTVTPLNLAASFSMIANGGSHVKPYLIEKIEDGEGNVIELPEDPYCKDCDEVSGADPENPGAENKTQEELSSEAPDEDDMNTDQMIDIDLFLTPQNAFLTRNIMKQVILTGTGRRALVLNRSDLAGKTGTTNNFRDAWFSGFSPDVLTTVFVGFDEPAHLGRRESGASAALPIWVDYMGSVLPDFPEKPEVIPANIVVRFINKETARATSPQDPDGYLEYYLAGTEPQNIVTETVENTNPENDSLTESLF